ncbi:MAG: DUF2235 domain-containing protein [Pseudomonadota bacterium]
MKLGRQIAAFLRLRQRRRWGRSGPVSHARGPVTHVVILDGTLSTLAPGDETNAGLTWKLMAESGPRADRSLYYEAGLQWDDWPGTRDVITGRGLNRQIERAYGFLASRYRPGDRIFLFGFSRGAFAVRSLAGAIHKVGLPRAEAATVRTVRQAYRHYRCSGESEAARAFTRLYCHSEVPIEMIGVWDTVKALGLRVPLLWRFSEPTHRFHTHELCPNVRHGYHALARNETRVAYAPEMWDTTAHPGRVEQRWFRGSHGDVGGQLKGFYPARPLANVPLVWMLDRAEAAGLRLPEGWRDRFPLDAASPTTGTWQGWGKAFLLRAPRDVGRDPSEVIDPSVAATPRPRRAHEIAPVTEWAEDLTEGAAPETAR